MKLLKGLCGLQLFLAFNVGGASKGPDPVRVLIVDRGFPYSKVRTAPEEWKENEKKLLELYSNAKSEKEKTLVLAEGFHAFWVKRELLEGVSDRDVRWSVVADHTADSVEKKLATNHTPLSEPVSFKGQGPASDEAKKRIDQAVDENIGDFEKSLKAQGAAPDLVNVSMSYLFVGTPELRGYEREKYTRGMEALLEKFPRTLFVFAAGNTGCDVAHTEKTYMWSGLKGPNAVLVGSLSCEARISGFSNRGRDVDVYTSGEKVSIDRKWLAPIPFLKKAHPIEIEGTSFSAPRFGRRVLDKLIELRKKPETQNISSVEVFQRVLAGLAPLKEGDLKAALPAAHE